MRILILAIFFSLSLNANVEHIHISNPVYDYLLRAQARGFIPNSSLAQLPLQRKEIIDFLDRIKSHENELTNSEILILRKYLNEFGIPFGTVDSLKYRRKINLNFNYKQHNMRVEPLASADARSGDGETATIGNGGFRISGTLGNKLGYNLQATNGTVVSGSRDLLLLDQQLSQNIKFARLNSDFDFTESHVRLDLDWFYMGIARERRLYGNGLFEKLYISNNAPPMDAVFAGVKINNVEYRFLHGSLISFPITDASLNSFGQFPPKYFAMHRFSWRPSWGELAVWEGMIYHDRPMDLAYLNPFAFYKSIEHSLRDRDNSMMGIDANYRPFKNLQLFGNFVLDDIIFSEIGNGYWSNKWAYSFGAMYTSEFNLDLGLEYARVEPFMYTHYNYQNSAVNDSSQFMGYLPPNSDQITLQTRYWWESRYPIKLDFSYYRHGSDVYEGDSLVVEAGGDIFNPNADNDPWTVEFLGGDLNEIFAVNLDIGAELYSGIHAHFVYRFQKESINPDPSHFLRFYIEVSDF